MFFKIPSRFQVDMPISTYNPDWAVYLNKNGEEKLYFILETKGSASLMDFSKKHFEVLGNSVTMEVATD